MVAALAGFFEVVALGVDVVGDKRFDRGFCVAVGICGADGAVFGDRDHVWDASGVTVDGGRGGEDDVGDVMLCHGGEEADRAIDVCAVVLQRDFSRLAYGLKVVSTTSFVDASYIRE